MGTGDGLDQSFTFAGDGVVGEVVSSHSWGERTIQVGLWADGWGTRGTVSAQVQTEGDGGIWLHVPVQTGLGEGVAALRLEGNSVLVPLGVRRDEFTLQLRREEVDQTSLREAASKTQASISTEQQAWKDGAFLLKEGDAVVGELRFRGDARPLVHVFDAHWLTAGPVPASVRADGAELLVQFPAEPSLRGEEAMLRINVPLRRAVAPIGPEPVPEERSFSLTPGGLDEDERVERVANARAKSDQREAAYVEDMARKMALTAKQEDGSCVTIADLDEAWSVLFTGYDVVIEQVEEGCMIGIEPKVKQHGRRYSGRVMP